MQYRISIFFLDLNLVCGYRNIGIALNLDLGVQNRRLSLLDCIGLMLQVQEHTDTSTSI